VSNAVSLLEEENQKKEVSPYKRSTGENHPIHQGGYLGSTYAKKITEVKKRHRTPRPVEKVSRSFRLDNGKELHRGKMQVHRAPVETERGIESHAGRDGT